jgi:hypothetical protein
LTGWRKHGIQCGTGLFDGNIHVTSDLILPMSEVGAKYSASLKDFAGKLAREVVNRLMIPAFDSLPGHDGAGSALVGLKDFGVGSLMMVPFSLLPWVRQVQELTPAYYRQLLCNCRYVTLSQRQET